MVSIARSVQDKVFEQLLRERPYEGCGLLAGHQGRIVEAYPTPNKSRSAVRYEIDPKDLLRVFREIDDADLELVAIYHSHTHTQAYPSATDIRFAHYPDAYYIIVTLMDIRAPSMRAFKIHDGEVSEEAVEVFEDVEPQSERLAG
ncbi:MAG: Mov34/MPN/PAD-1 family protein [Chloroflexota bacterium]